MTPLVLLIGFLGAGKTTLLRACLPELSARGLAVGVVLNDYMNARVDALTLAGLADDLTPVAGTCVCCDSRGEMLAALRAARLGPDSVMIIEANGTVDAADLIEVLVAETSLGQYTLPIQVSVVDVDRWQTRLWNDGLEADQVRTAAYVVLTRADTVPAGRRAAVAAEIRRLAPAAEIVDERALCGVLEVAVRASGDIAPRRFDRPAAHESAAGHHGERAHHHHHDHARHHFSALEVRLPRTVDRGRLHSWLAGLPSGVVRAKGVAQTTEGQWVYFARLDEAGSVSVQSVSGVDLDPVAILIGAGLPANLGDGAAALGGPP